MRIDLKQFRNKNKYTDDLKVNIHKNYFPINKGTLCLEK